MRGAFAYTHPNAGMHGRRNTMITIQSATSDEAIDQIVRLSQDYVTWMLAEIERHYPELDIVEFTSEHAYDDLRKKFPGEHVSPDGCLLIASEDEAVAGCVALGRLDAHICEMRTLFVRPQFRGKHIGKQLAEASLAEAHKLGYQRVRLDTLGFMESALTLYKSLGFVEIAPYRDLSESLKAYIHFLECDLQT